MIAGYNAIFQTILGTFFTWGFTALGAGLVFVFESGQRKILDGSLGFAAGVMTAASYWSLLAPAIEMAEQSGTYGSKGQWAFIPVSVGFLLGAVFVYSADILLPMLGVNTTNIAVSLESDAKKDKDGFGEDLVHIQMGDNEDIIGVTRPATSTAKRRKGEPNLSQNDQVVEDHQQLSSIKKTSWKRILLLVIAITIHNIPEGLAVGVGFGAIGKTLAATFENARNLAIGIGIQNFPEGLAVSLPLKGAGMSTLKSFWYGQLSGMVEPVAGLFGVLAVVIAEPILPYALAFAAGAMIYVVVDDIIPEAQTCGNGKLASWGAIAGFVVMMALDVGLG
ncbi:hypothetical protein CHS0354_028187 [Potamilus streckersoni]|uniref:Zinc transporter ZIP11 n=1 Tax=Potamilus streckersoni TaxID=2493646 RepID=A0AAE0TIY4_9BIVA|nr:hypothetical protein CHS0354_028187 [Potamilus streckersoni]